MQRAQLTRKRPIHLRKPLKPSVHRYAALIALFLSIFTFVPESHAERGANRFGFSIGYGAAGINTEAVVGSSQTTVNRAESPGMFQLFYDRLLSDRFSLGFEHERGFRMGPFSSQVSFTGLSGHWYFMGPAPTVINPADNDTILFVKRYVPYLGFSSGLAFADITREYDQAGEISGSGLYVGFKLGADYPISPGYGIRPELISATTIMSQGPVSTTLSEFAIQCGFYWDY